MRTKTLKVTSPAEPGADIEVLRWLTRESFEHRAAGLNLEIVEYTETEVESREVSSAARELYPDAKWIRFEAICKYPPEIEALLDHHYGTQ